MAVDVSRIPNNSKFDPVREAILDLQDEISSGVAGVSSVNNQTGGVTIAEGSNVSITTNNGVISISSTATAGSLDGELTLAAGTGIGLSSPAVFDGSEDLTITITNTELPKDGVLTLSAGTGLSIPTGETWTQNTVDWSLDNDSWASSVGATFSANQETNATITLEHGNTSSVADVTNSSGNVLQSMSFDEFGHVQSTNSTDLDTRYLQLTNANISEWDAAYDDKINSASFNTSDGVLTLTQQDGGTVTVDLDGRYATSTVNNYVSSVTFSTTTGVLTLNREGLSALTVDLDGKYLNIGDKAADSNLLDGLDSTYFLNYNNLTNTPTIPTVNDNTITLSAGGGMTGGGAFTVNQGSNETITISHADTSSQPSVNNSGTTFIQDVTLDTYGHVTGLSSSTISVPTVYNSTISIAAGTSMSGGGAFTTNQTFSETITINHGDTSSLSGTYGSTDDAVKIDTITVDSNGHVTNITTGPVSGGGGGTTPNNATITLAAGTSITGGGSFTTDQSFNETITFSHGNTSNLSGTYGSTNDSVKIDTITVDANGHITAITTGAVAGGGGGEVGTLQEVTNLGNTTTNSVAIGKSTGPLYTLDVSGTIRATNDIIAFSDARVKENVETISDAVEKVLCLRGVTFNKIGEEKRSIGVIAQEVEQIIPEAVYTAEDDMKAVAYGNMVGLLIEAIKEQQSQIDQLKAIINGSTK
jgi:hypothetical protein